MSGYICVFVDGRPIANGTLPLVPSAKTAQEIWFNARTWSEKDTGFRGSLHRFSMYPRVVTPIHMAQTRKCTTRKVHSFAPLSCLIRRFESDKTDMQSQIPH